MDLNTLLLSWSHSAFGFSKWILILPIKALGCLGAQCICKQSARGTLTDPHLLLAKLPLISWLKVYFKVETGQSESNSIDSSLIKIYLSSPSIKPTTTCQKTIVILILWVERRLVWILKRVHNLNVSVLWYHHLLYATYFPHFIGHNPTETALVI